MPLRITPGTPIPTPSLLECTTLYAIVERYSYTRRTRRADFVLGYYVHEAASLPDSQVMELPVQLQRNFSFTIEPEQADALESPMLVLETYAAYQLLQVLPAGTTIETVA